MGTLKSLNNSKKGLFDTYRMQKVGICSLRQRFFYIDSHLSTASPYVFDTGISFTPSTPSSR